MFKKVQRRVDEITQQLSSLKTTVNQESCEACSKTLEALQMELTKELGPKVEKMYEKACETDPEKQTYGPETSEKIKAMYTDFKKIDGLYNEVSEVCAGFVTAVNEERRKEEQKKEEEQRRKEEEEAQRKREEEEKRRLEQERLEQERLRQKEEEEARRREEEERKAAEAAELRARQEKQRQLEEEEKERKLSMLRERQKALAETIRLTREAKKKAEEEAARKAAEEEQKRKEALARAEEEKWTAMCAMEEEELDRVNVSAWEPVEGMRVREDGVLEVLSIPAFESLLNNPALPALCVYWHADRIEKSHEVLAALAHALPLCPHVRLAVVNTTQFPQLKFKYSAKQLSAQCFFRGDLLLSGGDASVLREFEAEVEQRVMMEMLGLAAEEAKAEADGNEMRAVEEETFGLVGVTEGLKKELEKELAALAAECAGEAKLQAAVDMWLLIVQNAVKDVKKFGKIKCEFEKLKVRLTGLKDGVRALSLSGFKIETISDVSYYVLKEGNVNKPWLNYLVNALKQVRCASFYARSAAAPEVSAPRQVSRQMPSQVSRQVPGPAMPELEGNPFLSMGNGGVDNDLFQYYNGLTDEELGMEMNGVLMSLAADPDVARTLAIVNESNGDFMAVAGNPEALPGIEKLRASPAFAAISAVLARRHHQ